MGRDWTEPVMLLANAVDSADLSLLPGIFRVLEVDYGASPTQLSGLVLSQAALKGLAYPVWGYLADRRPRKPLLATAAAAWAAAALLVATASSVAAMAALLGAGGVALACLMPLSQSILSDLFPPERRGAAFGRMFAAGDSAPARAARRRAILRPHKRGAVADARGAAPQLAGCWARRCPRPSRPSCSSEVGSAAGGCASWWSRR
jgi:MFS family permease